MPKRNKKIKLTNVGTRIRAWRKAVPMKAYELARLLVVSQGSLSEIENNLSLPSAETIAAFHEYTDIDIIWMLTGGRERNMKRIAPAPHKEITTMYLDEPGLYSFVKKL